MGDPYSKINFLKIRNTVLSHSKGPPQPLETEIKCGAGEQPGQDKKNNNKLWQEMEKTGGKVICSIHHPRQYFSYIAN